MDSLAQTLAGLKLFLDTLVDNHVGIHRHTKGQDKTRDTRQGKGCSEGGKCTEEEDNVGDKCEIGSQTCSTIEEDHVEEHEDECDDEGDES